MSETTYLVTLRPRGRFFFGGDRAFTASGEAVYAAESLRFPQQTALLGMLRYAMIRQEANATIGTGFDIETTDWGHIQALSPIFLTDTVSQKHWRPSGMNFQQEGDTVFELDRPCDKKKISNYDPKNGLLKNRWNCGAEAYNVEDFFTTIETVGNKKARDGKSQADGFFKQTAYQFVRELNKQKVELAFAFYATFKEPQKFDKVPSVIVGADQSAFGLKLTEQEPPNSSLKTGNKIVLLSDAYIPDYAALQNHCDFILGEVTPFRFMKPVQNNDYFTEKRRSPQQFNLLARGSVLYAKAENIGEIAKILHHPTFYQVGYNHFETLNQS